MLRLYDETIESERPDDAPAGSQNGSGPPPKKAKKLVATPTGHRYE